VENTSPQEHSRKKARFEPEINTALDRLNSKVKQKSLSPPKDSVDEVRTTFTITLDQVAEKAVKQAPQIAAKKLALKTAMDQAVRSSQKQIVDKDDDEAPADAHVVVAASQVPKCAFYPKCNKQDCPFFHPSEPCKKFPSCPFGDKCRYVHPEIPCKFGAKCTRPNCNYVHPKKNEVPCKFGAACTNPKCPFFHPKEAKEACPKGFACDVKEICPFKHPKVECRYKDQCRNKDRCAYSHAALCPGGVTCATVDCLLSHPAPKQTAQQPSGPASEEKGVASLSASLPKTPPQIEAKDPDAMVI
jgi:hypothetical protein